MAKDMVEWQSGETPIASTKLTAMTVDWIRNGLLILDSSANLAYELYTLIPPTPLYLGWYPYFYDRHVWNNLIIEGILHRGTASTARFEYGYWNGTSSTWYQLPGSPSLGNTYSTSRGYSSYTLYYNNSGPPNGILAPSAANGGTLQGYIGFRIAGNLGTWSAGNGYLCWNYRAYLQHASYPVV